MSESESSGRWGQRKGSNERVGFHEYEKRLEDSEQESNMIWCFSSIFLAANIIREWWCYSLKSLAEQWMLEWWESVHWKYLLVTCCCLVTKSCPTLCSPMDCSTQGLSVLHYLLEFVQTHVHWVSDANQPSHPLPPSSPFAFNPSQHLGLLQWVPSSHQVAKVLELQHQSYQWILKINFL